MTQYPKKNLINYMKTSEEIPITSGKGQVKKKNKLPFLALSFCFYFVFVIVFFYCFKKNNW